MRKTNNIYFMEKYMYFLLKVFISELRAKHTPNIHIPNVVRINPVKQPGMKYIASSKIISSSNSPSRPSTYSFSPSKESKITITFSLSVLHSRSPTNVDQRLPLVYSFHLIFRSQHINLSDLRFLYLLLCLLRLLEK